MAAVVRSCRHGNRQLIFFKLSQAPSVETAPMTSQLPFHIPCKDLFNNEDEDEDDEEFDQRRLDRISGILCTLIHEANAAIQHQPVLDDVTGRTAPVQQQEADLSLPLVPLDIPQTSSDPFPTASHSSASSASSVSPRKTRPSRLPRPTKRSSIDDTKLDLPLLPQDEQDEDDLLSPRRWSIQSWSSLTTDSTTVSVADDLFSPCSRSITTSLDDDQILDHPLHFSPMGSAVSDEDPILTSIERLDTSLALVGSLLHRDHNSRRPYDTHPPLPVPSQHPLTTSVQRVAPSMGSRILYYSISVTLFGLIVYHTLPLSLSSLAP
ncbi:hypothetical protein DM01DRAFT_1063952 [Hesseltinella vesiculosa]|uniref:Uncharacterized protein n=1 Tax=Hesseltinella vesiculosa TaxID=101127 RepID=A0A1X2GEC7_9FUNG|nr:hypothetical protein DM01DRAFT_1063952 [Hesseltinella vesiculosa]